MAEISKMVFLSVSINVLKGRRRRCVHDVCVVFGRLKLFVAVARH